MDEATFKYKTLLLNSQKEFILANTKEFYKNYRLTKKEKEWVEVYIDFTIGEINMAITMLESQRLK